MMKFLALPIYQGDYKFFLEPFTGCLLSKINNDSQHISKIIYKGKIKQALDHCNMPYMMKNAIIVTEPIYTSTSTKYYAYVLNRACKSSFWIGRSFANFGRHVFNNTADAIIAFRKVYSTNDQNDLCLSRTLFAAATSKTFKAKGVIFIGVFLPSRNMHAWIIEDGVQPDPYDTIWINYQPVAVLY